MNHHRQPNANNRGGLEDSPFSYREGKDGRVVISWRGQHAMILKGRKAAAFLSGLAAMDPGAQQLAMAKITGNFKRAKI